MHIESRCLMLEAVRAFEGGQHERFPFFLHFVLQTLCVVICISLHMTWTLNNGFSPTCGSSGN